MYSISQRCGGGRLDFLPPLFIKADLGEFMSYCFKSKHCVQKRPNASKYGDAKGQSTVEFALVLPLILLFIMLLFQAFVIMRANLGVAAASREGARTASRTGSTEEIVSASRKAAPNLDPDKMQVDVFCDNRERGSAVEVSVSYSVPIAFPFLDGLLNREFRVNSKTVMSIESDRFK